ncbi:MAG TPA: sugar ABC transporter permease [Chthonomonadaceae bacterium]|nr:sugar ABC transporter permease [Chthonomonadaceae bacterium]
MLKKQIVGYAFIGPWIAGFLIFTAIPFLTSVYLSFTRYTILTPPVWVGAANYRALLREDPLFWKSLGVTFQFAAAAVPLGILAGIGLALLLNQNVGGISVYRTIFYLPSIVPAVATSVLFLWILNPQIGLINRLLLHFGVVGPAWLQDPIWAPRSLVGMSLWGVGGSMIIYLAGLKDIPAHLYEAAVIDGANAWQRLRHVTLPMLTPVIFFNLVMGVIGTFQYFTEVYIMTQGGPEDSTLFYALYLFNRAWRYLDMGYASAMAWILFAIVMALTGFLFQTQRRWVHYGD